MVRSHLPIPEPIAQTSKELTPYSNEESQLIRIALDEPDQVERARKLAGLRGASLEFETLLGQNSVPYRSNPDLSALVLRAIEQKEQSPVTLMTAEQKENGLEQIVKVTNKKDITRLDVMGEYFTTYTSAIAKGIYTLAKGIYTSVKESLKAVLLPLLPGFMQMFIEKKTGEEGPRRVLYNTLSAMI